MSMIAVGDSRPADGCRMYMRLRRPACPRLDRLLRPVGENSRQSPRRSAGAWTNITTMCSTAAPSRPYRGDPQLRLADQAHPRRRYGWLSPSTRGTNDHFAIGICWSRASPCCRPRAAVPRRASLQAQFWPTSRPRDSLISRARLEIHSAFSAPRTSPPRGDRPATGGLERTSCASSASSPTARAPTRCSVHRCNWCASSMASTSSPPSGAKRCGYSATSEVVDLAAAVVASRIALALVRDTSRTGLYGPVQDAPSARPGARRVEHRPRRYADPSAGRPAGG